jgi:hypothetical protein
MSQRALSGLRRVVRLVDMDPHWLKPESWPQLEAYVKAVVGALKDERGLLMWDIMNEPSCNDYYQQAPPENGPGARQRSRRFSPTSAGT